MSVSSHQTAVRVPFPSIAMSGLVAYPSMPESATGSLQPPPAGRLATRTTRLRPGLTPVQMAAALPCGSTTTFSSSASSPLGETATALLHWPPTGRVAASTISEPPPGWIQAATALPSPSTATSCSDKSNCVAFGTTGDTSTGGNQPAAEAPEAMVADAPTTRRNGRQRCFQRIAATFAGRRIGGKVEPPTVPSSLSPSFAATALAHHLPVVTQDDDFDPVDGVSGLEIVRV